MELKGALLVVQLVTALSEVVSRLQRALSENNPEEVERLKKEILSLQLKIDAAL